MTTTCPACNKSVDPLRSRFVGVLDGKIVAYCSAACAGPRASGVASGAASGSARDPRPGSTAPAASPGSPREPVHDAPGSQTSEAAPGASVSPAEARQSRAPSGESGPAPGERRHPVPVRVVTPVSGVPELPRPVTPVSGVPISVDSGPVIEIVQDAEPSAGAGRPAPDSPGGRAEPRAKHPDEIAIGAFWSADKEKSGPVVPGKLAGPGRDDALDSGATDDASLPGRADSTAGMLRPRSRLSLVIVVLLVLGAGGVLAYQYLVKRGVAASVRPPAPAATAPAVVEAPRPPEPPPLDVAATAERARAVLRANLSAPSPRLTRLAAAALARTGDPAACQVLAGQLGLAGAAPDAETSDAARLSLAYALARAGDPRGSDTLAAGLGWPRSEARDEAARLLALLGDRRGVPRLTEVLAVSGRRLGAAEHLAHLAEPRALKVLDQLLGDPRASADDKARAVIALGNAGRADVAPALRDMLDDVHFNAFAAAALAALKDPAARPVLERQLDWPALRVRAARALRRLDPALDPAPLLPRLVAVLDTGDAGGGRDTEQIAAAEAILLLAGPPAWSAHE